MVRRGWSFTGPFLGPGHVDVRAVFLYRFLPDACHDRVKVHRRHDRARWGLDIGISGAEQAVALQSARFDLDLHREPHFEKGLQRGDGVG